VLQRRGYDVVEEAATDVNVIELARGHADPSRQPTFIDQIVAMQRAREAAPVPPGVDRQLFDRSPVCTLALSRYLGLDVSADLAAEIERISRDGIYHKCVFFVRPLGFVAPTAVRRISFEDSLAFERIHEDVYRELGYDLVDVPKADVEERVSLIERHLVAGD
jgi:predicted ATPase